MFKKSFRKNSQTSLRTVQKHKRQHHVQEKFLKTLTNKFKNSSRTPETPPCSSKVLKILTNKFKNSSRTPEATPCSRKVLKMLTNKFKNSSRAPEATLCSRKVSKTSRTNLRTREMSLKYLTIHISRTIQDNHRFLQSS